jgi:hypothetical protein
VYRQRLLEHVPAVDLLRPALGNGAVCR